MKVGVALNMLCQAGRSDASVMSEHLALGDLAEPLGFDSLFALEHHFTGYAMSPAPPQLLSYYAGRTRRITLGTAVIVLPWHDPIRVAEQIALLDILCGGRCLFGFGRGAASVEYAGFRVPMEEARPRFVEAAQIVVKALSQDSFEHEGAFYRIPRTAIRPRPISHPERRFYAAAADHPDQCVLCREPRRSARARLQVSRPEMAVDRRPLPFLRRPPRHGQGIRELRQDGAYLCQDRRKRRVTPKGNRFLRQHPDRRHAQRLYRQDRRIAAPDRARPSRHRIFVRRDAARGGRNQHAPLRRPGIAGPAARSRFRRRRPAGGRTRARARDQGEFVRAGVTAK